MSQVSVHEEKATIRQIDKIPYITPEDFKSNFPKGELLSSGNYGNVYHSGKRHVIKEFTGYLSFVEMVRELNFYAFLIHPCIMKPLYWTLVDNVGYFVMHKGKNIKEQYKKGKISLIHILYDVLSAITFMNARGIAHGDIKYENMVYYKGKCMIIDMGITRQGLLHSDGEYYFDDIAYTAKDRDGEYYYKQYNNIKVEIYSIATSLLSIIDEDLNEVLRLHNYPEQSIPKEIKWFMLEAKKLLKDRLPISKLLTMADELYRFEPYVGTILDVKMESVSDTRIPILMEQLVKIGYRKNLKVKTVFLGLHLLHRVYKNMFNKYNNDDSKILIIGAATMHLAMITDMNEEVIDTDTWAFHIGIQENSKNKVLFDQILQDILIECGGIIQTLTYWDYAKSKEDLLPLLHDIINFNYDPLLIRETGEGTNKCIKMKELMSSKVFDEYIKDKKFRSSYKEELPPKSPAILNSCKLDLFEDVKMVEDLLVRARAGLLPTFDELINVVMHNRHVLHKLKLSDAIVIYKALYKSKENKGIVFLLDIICTFEWKTDKLKHEMHPFQIR